MPLGKLPHLSELKHLQLKIKMIHPATGSESSETRDMDCLNTISSPWKGSQAGVGLIALVGTMGGSQSPSVLLQRGPHLEQQNAPRH